MCDDLGISDEKINVYFLKAEPYLENIAYPKEDLMITIEEQIDNLQDGEYLEFDIKMRVMSRSQFEKLPEFDG